MLEPLSVAIHAVRRAAVEQGDTAVVFGAGAVGLLTAAMAKVSGATTVLIADIDVGRVEYALRHGFATRGYVVSTGPQPQGTDEKLIAAEALAGDVVEIACAGEMDAEGADVTFDCTGKEMCMQAGLYVSILIGSVDVSVLTQKQATRPGGKLIMVGMGTPVQTLPMSVSHLKEVDIIGVFRYANTYPTGLKMIASGVLPSLDMMITHRFSGLESAKEAFEVAGKTVDDDGNLVLKVLVEC